ncbi:phosphatidylserine decarboxylase [Ruminiclostridium papyrosolvens]|uniref:Phosphatidylserine decarboxylase proenzyme n=1 Tax=Ruminiclostridium papyrosolvens C7 TaxID=1330534 RepID=U4QZU4_9FIRM|nr:phosphatidylserine decarboxylase [Ruminiclostridium papyrosolvens]EPR10381.1 phosphatidylserine decarboxylase [Ruminiclostridium papyrosolvens C7]
MIQIYNRKTKKYDIEQVAGGKLLDTLYTTGRGRLGLELLVKRKLYSALTGFFCDRKISRKTIKGFADKFSIDINECENKLEDFNSFNDFFARKMKPSARKFDKVREKLLSPGDGRLQALENIDKEKLLQIKGMTYSLSELLQDEKLAEEYNGGTYLILRLCPVDYHRFHFFDSGKCMETHKIKGKYYSVNPVALKKIPELFCRNKREYSIFKTDNFGEVLFIEVGATSVGSIIQTYTPGEHVSRGDEKGFFKFGGSTVLLIFKKNMVKIDEDIIQQTGEGFETRVLAGDIIGNCIEKRTK